MATNQLKEKVRGMSLREFLVLRVWVEQKPGRRPGSFFSRREAERIKEKYNLSDEEVKLLVSSKVKWI